MITILLNCQISFHHFHLWISLAESFSLQVDTVQIATKRYNDQITSDNVQAQSADIEQWQHESIDYKADLIQVLGREMDGTWGHVQLNRAIVATSYIHRHGDADSPHFYSVSTL